MYFDSIVYRIYYTGLLKLILFAKAVLDHYNGGYDLEVPGLPIYIIDVYVIYITNKPHYSYFYRIIVITVYILRRYQCIYSILIHPIFNFESHHKLTSLFRTPRLGLAEEIFSTTCFHI